MKKLLLSLGLLTVMAMPACAEKYATVNVDYAMSKFPAAQQATDALRQESKSKNSFSMQDKTWKKHPLHKRKQKKTNTTKICKQWL